MFSMIQTGNKTRLSRDNSHFYKRQSIKGSWSRPDSDRGSFSVFWQTDKQVNLRQHRGLCNCPEIHPLLRRSICTLILAILCIGAGVTVTLVLAFSKTQTISLVGVILMGVGLVLMIAGSIWYYMSRKQLIQFETKLSRLRITKIAKKFNDIEMCKIDRAGNTTCKWPLRKGEPPGVTFQIYEEDIQPHLEDQPISDNPEDVVFYGGP